jgi:NADPH2:quinone reductase
MGARVIACASSDDKLAFTRKHGADEGINYASEDIKEGLRRVTGGKGADVIYDPVGGKYTEPALRSIAWQGRFLVVGFAAGDIPKLPLNPVLLKGCDVLGVFWGAFLDRDLEGHRANTRQLIDWCVQGKVSSHVHATYPLSDGIAALKSIAARQVMGKVILRP